MSCPHTVHEWAKVKSALREASLATLESHGHTWDSFNQLERDAASQMSEESVVTEYGRVQRIPDGPIQYKPRRLDRPNEDLIPRRRLKLHAAQSTTNHTR